MSAVVLPVKSNHRSHRGELRALFDAAVGAVSARAVMPSALPLDAHGRTVLIAVGKAAGDMMLVAAERAARPFEGLLVTRAGHLPPGLAAWPQIETILAGHPTPDDESVRAAERALALCRGLEASDRLLVLLSGGGSALLAAPAEGLTLSEKQAVTRALLRCGATISEINCVRKRLSRIKGGRLAAAAGRARVTTLIISDVPGDDPSHIASGPTVADGASLEAAREIVDRYGIDVSPAVAAALANPLNETPARDVLGLAGAETRIIARARDAFSAAGRLAETMGYAVTNLGDHLEAEARHLGAGHAALARNLASDGSRRAILSGGETTVTVTNPQGRGGRNLEYLLGLAIGLQGHPGISAIACDTDGIDGTEDAAGAVVHPDTLDRARMAGLDPVACLKQNNAYLFFERLGDLVVTGPTRTNVNDFRAILIEGA